MSRAPNDPTAFANPTDRDIVEWLPRALPDRRIRYGDDPLQFADLRIPRSSPPGSGHPVVVVLHGGGYSPSWNLDSVAPLAERLTVTGQVATWNVEYRRPGQPGGGWPGTWLDIAHGIDHLKVIADAHRLDLNRVVAVGHSAGATFATWAASRAAIDEAAPLFVPDPVRLRGVVSLAGILDLGDRLQAPEPSRNLQALLSGPAMHPTDDLPTRLAAVSPVQLASRVVAPQRLIVGGEDAPTMIDQTQHYDRACTSAGRAAQVDHLDGANHFDLIDPSGAAWPVVAGAVFSMLGLRVSPDPIQ